VIFGPISGVRVEWCQSRARALRFSEEVDLLTEEMARILRFFEWKARDWQQKGDARVSQAIPEPMSEAYKAYAERQAALYCSLYSHFKNLWSDLLAHVTHMRSLANSSLPVSSEEFQKKKKVRGRPRKEP